MSGNDFRKSQALRRRQKIICDDDDVISSGRAFQTRGPATGKARLPTFESSTGGTGSRLVSAVVKLLEKLVHICKHEPSFIGVLYVICFA